MHAHHRKDDDDQHNCDSVFFFNDNLFHLLNDYVQFQFSSQDAGCTLNAHVRSLESFKPNLILDSTDSAYAPNGTGKLNQVHK